MISWKQRPEDLERKLTTQVMRAVTRASKHGAPVPNNRLGEELRLIRCPGQTVRFEAQFEGENPEIIRARTN